MNFKFGPGDSVKAEWIDEPLHIIRRIYSLEYPAYLCRWEGVVPEEDLTLITKG